MSLIAVLRRTDFEGNFVRKVKVRLETCLLCRKLFMAETVPREKRLWIFWKTMNVIVRMNVTNSTF